MPPVEYLEIEESLFVKPLFELLEISQLFLCNWRFHSIWMVVERDVNDYSEGSKDDSKWRVDFTRNHPQAYRVAKGLRYEARLSHTRGWHRTHLTRFCRENAASNHY